MSLPNYFSINRPIDLIRIGKDNDGGYLVSRSDIEKTDVLIGLGINDDWSFEENFKERKNVKVFAYDASISADYFFKEMIKAVLKFYNLRIFLRSLHVFLKYKKFFSQKDIRHVQKFVGVNTHSNQYCTFLEVLSETESANIFLKIDIEGSEYRILNDIIASEQRISGLVIEFHDVDLHLNDIKEFIKKFSLKLAHVHANNCSPVRADDDLPLVLELTFSRCADFLKNPEFPHELDMPNNKLIPEYEIAFRQ